jgi:DNA-binding transcriptional ArsR family regulator
VRTDSECLASVAALIGDPSRAAMLDALLDGREHAAGELGRVAGIAPATTARHLERLESGGLIRSRRSGRERLCSLGGPEVTTALEALAALAPDARPRTLRQATRMDVLRRGRTCYDHLAGRLGVAVADAAREAGAVEGTMLTRDGERWLEPLGVDLDAVRAARRPFLRTCVDWTEKREHLAGALGAALCARVFELGWVARVDGSRALAVTAAGEEGLARLGVATPG